MAQTSTYTIACPTCKKEQEVELHDALRVSLDPEIRDALMANELNKIRCDCGFEFRVDKNLLYHDDTRGVMIHLVHAPIEQAERVEQDLLASLQALNQNLPANFKPPRVLLVLSRAELVERIFLIEAGLDERIIEYCKHTIYARNLKHVPFQEKILLFDAQGSDEDNLHFVVMDAKSHRLESVIAFKREAYRAIAEAFNQDDKTGHLLELFPGPYISARRLLMRQESQTSS